jgi:hypothetical protein
MIRSNRNLTAACAAALLLAFASPLAATNDSATGAKPAEKPKPVVVIETPELKCWEKPPICNCQGADNCPTLKSSGYCKDGTYNFWTDENMGTCVWNGTK